MNKMSSLLNMVRSDAVNGSDTLDCRDYELGDFKENPPIEKRLSYLPSSDTSMSAIFPIQVVRDAYGMLCWGTDKIF